jgi:uncharacterized protein
VVIGIISDTHGLLRPEVFQQFEGVELIVHAGDVGPPDLLDELGAIAPVKAVYGNTDRFPLLERLPDRLWLQLEEVRVFVTHIGGRPPVMRARYPEIAGANLVVFGHSHRPLLAEDNGVSFFNPGAAGPRRFSLPVTLGLVEIQGAALRARVVELKI